MFGRGSTISVKDADGVCDDPLHTQKNPWVHLGHFQLNMPSSLCSLTSFKCSAAFRLVFLPADEAGLSVFSRVRGAATPIPSVAGFNVCIEHIRLGSFRGGTR